MFVVCVSIKVRPERIVDFIEATRLNHEGTLNEPGATRFDVLQAEDDETHFCLYEVYRTADDLEAHRNTPHFQAWRDAAEPMMAEPRTRIYYKSIFPEPWK